ncbi:hypothetical protein ACFQX6_10545 [Streptosporangium lutulentum]
MADQRLAEAIAHGEYDLLGDELPWDAREWEGEEETCAELMASRSPPSRTRCI